MLSKHFLTDSTLPAKPRGMALRVRIALRRLKNFYYASTFAQAAVAGLIVGLVAFPLFWLILAAWNGASR